ncbi:MAG TPA: GNAT family N-acetyltransferase, partial [Mycobacterium sp.]|nr:GNAT family N-acetyltransferase [Mycobacterium sp.]
MVREQRPEDAVAFRKLLTDAFADDGAVADLAQALDARPDRPGIALVADMDGTPVGHVQLSRGWVDARPRLIDVLILSPLAVTPTHQRRGIGRRLCQAAVHRAGELAVPAVLSRRRSRLL